VREWDLPRQASELAAANMTDDKPWNKVEHVDGTAICRRCALSWNDYVHGC